MSDQPEKPEGWEREAEEIRQRYDWAEAMGGEEAVRLRHEKGFLTVRERIAGIADPDSFQEVGKLTGKGQYDEQGRIIKVSPAPYVMGIAEVDGRPVAIGGEDTTVRGGTSWGHGRRKGGQGGFIDDLAYHYRIPLIRLIDGYGGGVASAKRGFTVFPGHTNQRRRTAGRGAGGERGARHCRRRPGAARRDVALVGDGQEQHHLCVRAAHC